MTNTSDTLSAHDGRLPDFPQSIFLDTNVVQNLLSFGDVIYENAALAESDNRLSGKGPRIRADVLALAELMALGRRGGLPIVISSNVCDELADTPSLAKRERLVFWGTELAFYSFGQLEVLAEGSKVPRPVDISGISERQRCFMAKLMSSLKDEGDRQLMIDALVLRCEVFLTMEYKTIWRVRDDIKRFGIRILRPVELLDEIRPWAGLLR